MPAATLDRPTIAAPAALRFNHVSKVFCDSLMLARKYAMRDTLQPRADRMSELRPGEWVALRDISFELKQGQTLLVLGVAGSGKTALADLITGPRVPDAGTIERHGSIGLLGGGKYGMNPFMKVREYVRLMAALQGADAADLDHVCEAILEWTELTEHRNSLVFDLPKALLSPLSLASSLLVEHDVYVFDDYRPLGDSDLDRRLETRLNEILDTRSCVVLGRGPHTPSHVDDVLILHKGEVIYAGKPDPALPVYDRFSRQVRYNRDGRSAGADGSGQAPRRPSPSAAEATALVREMLRGAGEADSAIEREIARLVALNRPVVVGPCLSDLSWEALFWIPFVTWARRHLGTAVPTVAVSKGAIGSWYARAADTYIDVYDLIPPAAFYVRDQERTRETSSLKQRQISTFEREIIELVGTRSHFPTVESLHPSVLLGLSAQIWRGHLDIGELTSRAVYERLPAISEDLPGVPAKFLACCFRFTTQFPDNQENLALVGDTIRMASAKLPVMVLGGGGRHAAFLAEADGGQGVQLVDLLADAQRLPRIQASVVGGAQAVIGTLNGPVTLAPFFGVPAMCVHPSSHGFLEFQIGCLRHAAGQLDTVLETRATGAVTAYDMSRWLDDVLNRKSSLHAGSHQF